MNRDGNMARWIRAATETLGEYAEEYRDAGQEWEAEQFEEARDRVSDLHALADPGEEETA